MFLAGVGFGVVVLLAGTWLGVKFGWTHAPSRMDSIVEVPKDSAVSIEDVLRRQIRTRERIGEWMKQDPVLGEAAWKVLSDSGDGLFVARMLDAGDWSRLRAPDGNAFGWSRTDIWDSTLAALVKDREVILLAARETGLSPRLVALPALCEQMRRAETFRDQYKRVFSKFIPTGNLSMGVTGIKPETLRRIVPWCDPRFLPPLGLPVRGGVSFRDPETMAGGGGDRSHLPAGNPADDLQHRVPQVLAPCPAPTRWCGVQARRHRVHLRDLRLGVLLVGPGPAGAPVLISRRAP